jgi:hypothetical protein
MPTDLPIMLEDYKRHMPKDGDLTLHVLKGHLVIEQYMTAVIEKVALNPRHLSKANLNFSQKVASPKHSLDQQSPRISGTC